MHFEPNYWYHVYNRGNNRQRIFFNTGNYLYFLKKIRCHVTPLADIIAYCLMPNQFHLLTHVKSLPDDGKLNRKEIRFLENRVHPLVHKISILLSSYAQGVNNQQNRTGSLFTSKTKAKNLSRGDRDYAETCFHYIHQNPVKAGLVSRLAGWEYSSYKDYAGLRNGSLPAKRKAFNSFAIRDEKHFTDVSEKVLKAEMVEHIF